MSETTTPDAPQAMQIQINAQYIKDFSFENPNAPASLQPQEQQPKIDVNVDVSASRVNETEVYEVVLKINADAKSGDRSLFITELTYGGLFTLKGINEQNITPILLIECPRLLFPFARNIVAEATRDGGFPPLLIQPVDFAGMYRQTMAQQQDANAAKPGNGASASMPDLSDLGEDSPN